MRKYLTKVFNELFDARTITTTSQTMPIGYTPLESITGALFHWVAVPFNGQKIWCQLRCPNATQLEQCGDLSNITLDRFKDLKKGELPKYTKEELIQLKNYQEEICKVVFNIPTFDNITSLVGNKDFVISEKRKELKELKEKFETHKNAMSEANKKTLYEQIRKIELQIGYILPDDTMSFATNWAMGNDISDIQKITKEQFLRAASLAKLHHKAPSDYLSGVFTDFNRHEIDTYAAMVLDEHMKAQEVVENSKNEKNRWIGMGR